MDTALIDTLINLGAGFIVVTLILLGFLVPKWVVTRLEKENEDLKTALALERQRSDAATSVGAVAVQIIGAMRDVAERRDLQDQHREQLAPPGRDAEL